MNRGKYSQNKKVSFSQTMSNFKNQLNLNNNNNSRNITERNNHTEVSNTESNINKNSNSSTSKNKNDIKVNTDNLLKKRIRLGRKSAPSIKIGIFNDEIPEGKKPANILNLQFNFTARDISLGTSVKKDFNENNIKNYSRSSIDCSNLPDMKSKTSNNFFALKK